MLTQKNRNKLNVREVSFQAHPVKLTALSYLQDALLEERYEEMKEFVEIAKEFGANVWEIRKALTRSEARKG